MKFIKNCRETLFCFMLASMVSVAGAEGLVLVRVPTSSNAVVEKQPEPPAVEATAEVPVDDAVVPGSVAAEPDVVEPVVAEPVAVDSVTTVDPVVNSVVAESSANSSADSVAQDSVTAEPIVAETAANDSVALDSAIVDSAANNSAPQNEIAVLEIDSTSVSKLDSLPQDSLPQNAEEPKLVLELPGENKQESEKHDDGMKILYGGVFLAATYNDFYDSKLGLGSIGQRTDKFNIVTRNAEDLAGNYWGVGANAGLGLLVMPAPFFGVHLEVGGSFRQGHGESKASVILVWKDGSNPERNDLDLEYSEKQVNVDIPLLFRFAIPGVAYLEAGPMASINVYSKDEMIVEDYYGKSRYKQDDVCDRFEFDVAFGIGTSKQFGFSMLDLSLRMVIGVTPLNADAADSPKTWQGQFNVAYWFL